MAREAVFDEIMAENFLVLKIRSLQMKILLQVHPCLKLKLWRKRGDLEF